MQQPKLPDIDLPFLTSDAKTSAPAWPNLSTASVSGRNYTTEAPVMSTRPQDDKHSQGKLSYLQLLHYGRMSNLEITAVFKAPTSYLVISKNIFILSLSFDVIFVYEPIQFLL